MRDPESDKYVGSPENWDKAEQALREAAEWLGADYSEAVSYTHLEAVRRQRCLSHSAAWGA